MEKNYEKLKNLENTKFQEKCAFSSSLNLSYDSTLFIAIGRILCKTPPEK